MVDRPHNLSKRYPEVMRFDSRKEADKAVQACKKQLIKTPGFWFGLVGYTAGVGLAVFLIIMSCRGWIPISRSMLGGVVGGVTGASGTVALTWFWRHRFRRFLRQELIHRGVPICLKCGYDLRGQTESRGPECGASFDPGLIETEHEST